MLPPIPIDPEAIYPDGAVVLALDAARPGNPPCKRRGDGGWLLKRLRLQRGKRDKKRNRLTSRVEVDTLARAYGLGAEEAPAGGLRGPRLATVLMTFRRFNRSRRFAGEVSGYDTHCFRPLARVCCVLPPQPQNVEQVLVISSVLSDRTEAIVSAWLHEWLTRGEVTKPSQVAEPDVILLGDLFSQPVLQPALGQTG